MFRATWLVLLPLVACGAEDRVALCTVERPSLFRIAHADGSFSEGPFDCRYGPAPTDGDPVDVTLGFSAVTSHAIVFLKLQAANRTWSVQDGALGGPNADLSLLVEDYRFEGRPDRTSKSGTISLDVERWPVDVGESGRVQAVFAGQLDDDSSIDATLDFTLHIIPPSIVN